MRHWFLFALIWTGCHTTLRHRRDLPPSLVLPGPVIGIDVDGPASGAVREELRRSLSRWGQVVDCFGPACQASAVVRVRVVDTEVAPTLRFGRPDPLRTLTDVTVRALVDIDVGTTAGQQLLHQRNEGTLVGNVLRSPVEWLTASAATRALRPFLRLLQPRHLESEFTIETGGDLDLGVERALTGDLPGAESEFSRLTQQTPRAAAAWYNLGVVAEIQGYDDRALKAYQQAVALNRKSLYISALDDLERRLGTKE
jgi:hypothetical protein